RGGAGADDRLRRQWRRPTDTEEEDPCSGCQRDPYQEPDEEHHPAADSTSASSAPLLVNCHRSSWWCGRHCPVTDTSSTAIVVVEACVEQHFCPGETRKLPSPKSRAREFSCGA